MASTSEERVDLQTTLHRLNEASSITQGRQLKLGTGCLGIGKKKLEEAHSISEVYQHLKGNELTTNDSLALVQVLLIEVGMTANELNPFTSPEALGRCRNRKDFAFAKMVLGICNDMDNEDFKKFSSLFLGHFKHQISLDKFPTIEKFFSKLIQGKIVWPGSVECLATVLEEMGKGTSLDLVEEYRRTIGSLGQDTAGSEHTVYSSSSSLQDANEAKSTVSLKTAVQATDKYDPTSDATSLVKPGLAAKPVTGLVYSGRPRIDSRASPGVSDMRHTMDHDDTPTPDIASGNAATQEPQPFQKVSSDGAIDSLTTVSYDSDQELVQFSVSSDTERDCPQRETASLHNAPRDSGIAESQVSLPSNVRFSTSIRFGGQPSNVTQAGKEDDSSSLCEPTDERTPLTERDTGAAKPRSVLSLLKYFYQNNKKKLLSLLFVLIAIGLCVGVFGPGVCLRMVNNGLAEHQVSTTSLAHEGDVIILGQVDSIWYDKVRIEESLKTGDSSHISDIYHATELQKHKVTDTLHRTTLYHKKASRTTGVIDFVYLLSDSFINYTFCAAYQFEADIVDENMSDDDDRYVDYVDHIEHESRVYIFDDYDRYLDYVDQKPGAESHAVDSKTLSIGMYNVSQCTSLEYTVQRSAYYFIAASTQGDIYFNVSYVAQKVFLEARDYDTSGQVAKDFPADLSLDEPDVYFMLAQAQPNQDSGSTLTHISLMTVDASPAKLYQLKICKISMIIFSSCLIALICVCCCYLLYLHRQRFFLFCR